MTTITSPSSELSRNRADTRRHPILHGWLESLVVAAGANITLWLLITQLLSTPLTTKEELAIGGSNVQIPLLLITTLVATSAATLGRFAAGKVLSSPVMPWVAVSLLAGLASLGGPASSAATTEVQVGLSSMHLVTAAIVIIAHLRRSE